MTPEKDPYATNKLKSESQAKEEEVEKNCEENEHDEESLEEGTTEACENCEEGREKGSEDRSELEDKTENATARNLSGLLDNTLQRNPLPHFFVYITWVMLVGTMATCAFFLNLYSMQWGSTTSEEWLASFFASFAESFFLFEPLKVGMGVLHLLRRKCLPVSATEGGYGFSSPPPYKDSSCLSR